jgi:hypothetical protein
MGTNRSNSGLFPHVHLGFTAAGTIRSVEDLQSRFSQGSLQVDSAREVSARMTLLMPIAQTRWLAYHVSLDLLCMPSVTD